jgi:hypothetical protein
VIEAKGNPAFRASAWHGKTIAGIGCNCASASRSCSRSTTPQNAPEVM